MKVTLVITMLLGIGGVAWLGQKPVSNNSLLPTSNPSQQEDNQDGQQEKTGIGLGELKEKLESESLDDNSKTKKNSATQNNSPTIEINTNESPGNELASKAHRLGVSLLNANPTDKKSLPKALGLLEQAVKLQPDNPTFKLNLADAYYREGSNAAILLAMELYENLLVDEAMHEGILARLAYCYAKLENHQAAMAVASRRVEDKNAIAFPIGSQIIEFTIESGDWRNGREYLEYIIAKRPDELEVNFLLALILKQLGEVDDARKLADSTAAKLPNDSPFREAANRISLGVTGGEEK